MLGVPSLTGKKPAIANKSGGTPTHIQLVNLHGPRCKNRESHYSTGIQVLSGLYSDMAAATFAVSGPRSF